MAKHSTRKEQEGDTRYLFIYKWEMETPAYRALSGDQAKIYYDMRTHYNGRNNGAIKYSARKAATIIQKDTTTGARAIKRLVELGFLKVRRDSTFGQKRLSREYELTAISRAKAQKKSKLPEGSCDFRRWTEAAIQADVSEKKRIAKARKTKASGIGAAHSGMRASHNAKAINAGGL